MTMASEQLEDARTRMTALANRLVMVLPPMDVAGVLAGAAIGVLRTHYGPEKAAEYMTELAVEMNTDQSIRKQ